MIIYPEMENTQFQIVKCQSSEKGIMIKYREMENMQFTIVKCQSSKRGNKILKCQSNDKTYIYLIYVDIC